MSHDDDKLIVKLPSMSERKRADLLEEAQERFDRCKEWESEFRAAFVDDLRFANADSRNKFQWPHEVRTAREKALRPMLTINKTRQHNLNILNDMRQNKPTIKFLPMAGDASFKSAQALNSIMRTIEANSAASVAYQTAAYFQVTSGLGYIRVGTEYVSERSFDQDIKIMSVDNPMTVYLDPDHKELDGRDSKFGFVFEDMDREAFEKKYPKYKDCAKSDGSLGFNDWLREDRVRICEYYRITETPDRLVMMSTGEVVSEKEISSKAVIDALIAEGAPAREVTWKQLEWMLIVGNEVVDGPRPLPGKFIPIVPVVGEQIIIEGKLDRKGHTRAMQDPQRMYNYWSSGAVEYGALQTKVPWVGPKDAFEGHELTWAQANDENVPYLPYNHVGEDGQPIPPPVKTPPPNASSLALAGMQVAAQELELVSGQYAQQMGAPGNERTGAAIGARQEQSDKSTFHYADNMAIALRQVGNIIVDLLPSVYDTKRMIMALGEDNVASQMQLDPEAPEAYQGELDDDGNPINQVFNPTMGRYLVMADVGKDYGTRRRESFDAFKILLSQAPTLTGIVGDLMFRAADFPMADEAAARLKRTVPPAALGKGPTPNEQKMQMQIQNLSHLVQELVSQLAHAKVTEKAREEDIKVKQYDAITKRLKVAQDGMDMGVQADLNRDALMVDLLKLLNEPKGDDGDADADDPLAGAMPGGEQMALPLGGGMPHAVPGMRRENDGSWQVREPGGTYAPVGHVMGPHAGVPTGGSDGQV